MLLILVGGGGVSPVTIDGLVVHLERLGKGPRVQRCDIVPDLEQSQISEKISTQTSALNIVSQVLQ